MTLAQLNKGEKAIIEDLNTDLVPLKLIEMCWLPGNQIELLQLAPFKDPLFLNVNGAQVAIRKETAEHIQVKRTAEWVSASKLRWLAIQIQESHLCSTCSLAYNKKQATTLELL